jgi:hypothetical protein
MVTPQSKQLDLFLYVSSNPNMCPCLLSVDPEEVGIAASYISNLPIDVTSPAPSMPAPSCPVDVQQRDYMEIQAKIFAERQPLTPMKELHEYIRIIDKDVPRTDRDYQVIR